MSPPNRAFAVKVCINQVTKDFLQEQRRIKIVGILIGKGQGGQIVLDDGTGQITAKVFDRQMVSRVETMSVGEVVSIFGRVNDFDDRLYIVGEVVVKLTDRTWMELHRKESKSVPVSSTGRVQEKKEVDSRPIHEKVVEFIRSHDSGEGVLINDIEQGVGVEDIQSTIDVLLQDGEIFEISPGKVKLLE